MKVGQKVKIVTTERRKQNIYFMGDGDEDKIYEILEIKDQIVDVRAIDGSGWAMYVYLEDLRPLDFKQVFNNLGGIKC